MSNRKLSVFFFILVALAQLYVPAKMIFDLEDVLETGREFKFKTAPIDPNDPFRGKYITLNYSDNTFEARKGENWVGGEKIYVSLEPDIDGFAKISAVSKEKPAREQDFIKAKVAFVIENGSGKIAVQYPFDRFYMGEFKANDAEQAYNRSLQDTSRVTYALVMIKNGAAVLKDVLIDGISIEEIVRTEQLIKN